MKNLLLLTALISSLAFGADEAKTEASLSDSPSGVYVLEPYHGYLTFSYDHSNWSFPTIKFEDFSLNVNLDNENHANSSVDMVIQAASIHTGSKVFDGHMGNMFFKTADNPEITVSGKGYNASSQNTGTMTVDLTIAGVTHPVELDITINGAGPHPHFLAKKAPGLGISGTAVVDATQWFASAPFPAPNEVTISLEAELIAESGAQALADGFEKMFGPRQ